jgi:hypothetical protein
MISPSLIREERLGRAVLETCATSYRYVYKVSGQQEAQIKCPLISRNDKNVPFSEYSSFRFLHSQA